jgi:hypothetical protein
METIAWNASILKIVDPRMKPLLARRPIDPRRHCERSEAIQGPPPPPYDPMDCFVVSLLATTGSA